MECVQTDNGFEFTNRFSNSRRDLTTLFEATAQDLGVRHKLIRPYTPRHNGKAERSHREDQRREALLRLPPFLFPKGLRRSACTPQRTLQQQADETPRLAFSS